MALDSNMLMMTYGKYFPSESAMQVKTIFDNMSEDKQGMLGMLGLKEPVIVLVISVLLGQLGIDRFYIGDNTSGALKLITCGGLGFWTIIDWFLIMKATQEKNLEKLLTLG